MMPWIVKGFGLFIAAMSLSGIFHPRQLANRVAAVARRPWGLEFAVGVRIALGTLFLLAAEESAHPRFIAVLGYLMLVAAAVILLLGRARLVRITDYFTAHGNATLRGLLALGVVFGVALALLA